MERRPFSRPMREEIPCPSNFQYGTMVPAGYVPDGAIPHKNREALAYDPFGKNGYRPDPARDRGRAGDKVIPSIFPGLNLLQLFPEGFTPDVVALSLREADRDLGRVRARMEISRPSWSFPYSCPYRGRPASRRSVSLAPSPTGSIPWLEPW